MRLRLVRIGAGEGVGFVEQPGEGRDQQHRASHVGEEHERQEQPHVCLKLEVGKYPGDHAED